MRKSDKGIQIFCPVRKKWLINTPEEWVRQHVICFLNTQGQFALQNMVTEFPVAVNRLHQRADVLIHQNLKPFMLVECKKPSIPLTQKILDQATRYAQILRTEQLMLSNGLQHIYAQIDFENQEVAFSDSPPTFP